MVIVNKTRSLVQIKINLDDDAMADAATTENHKRVRTES